ncbi:acylneuraminate cytidylyltransferase family protein [Cochleicola gelatinilyticus]|uniref:Acylneuraminate cytidylyltransferase n=1 Tax=Cochleicola gelatinilyticus TaxID=1763537 RepID=A0A167EP58_9FLAO|nr:acylneuraminate cytidylyltransferase family protein [Cochleicola gelatinilyticus]OAB75736.1 acylneuraminate cytidylyltransferase [Cochleicola gelatinilyticus]
MRILGLIPARGGSKGIPNKNRKDLNGKPLLQYTIEAALASEKLERVVFTSEDETLITLATKMGAEVPFVRPAYLSQDTSGSLEVVQHALKELSIKGENFDAVCLLQVTTPFRSPLFIDEAISVFIKKQTDSLISVQKVPHQYNPHWVFEASRQTLKIATGEKEIIKRRQELPESFIRDGSIYITKTEVLLEQNSFFGTTISYLESNPKTYVNIDTEADWKKAETIAKTL